MNTKTLSERDVLETSLAGNRVRLRITDPGGHGELYVTLGSCAARRLGSRLVALADIVEAEESTKE